MQQYSRNLVVWLFIFLGVMALVNIMSGSSRRAVSPPVAYSDFISEVNQGRISDVEIRGNNIIGNANDGRTIQAQVPNDPQLIQRLMERNVRITAKPPEDDGFTLTQYIMWYFPFMLLIAVWIFMWRQVQGSGSKAMSFGKSRARMMGERSVKVTFADVAGVDEAKQELEEIVDYLKDPQKFQRLGGRIPRGVLLVGPPGTGKTLLARAIAGEANVPFFSISGSEFVEMFVGVGASRVRDLFEQGKKNAPCLIFIDEIDAVGRHRGAGYGGGNDEREQTLNQLLVEMDGFEANDGVIIIAATNRPDVLDQALLRPGRFDRQVVVPNPDINGREKILKVHMSKVPLAPNVDPLVIARGTPGFSGADLANLVNEAALLAARRGKRVVAMEELEYAKDKVMMGAERRSMAMTDEQKRLTAYHEAGHAIVAYHLPDSDPIHKATIIPRGRALGMVMRLPEGDRISMSRARLEADLCVAAGGRLAEEIIFGTEKITTGASSDIKQVTDTARRMVLEWGMSDKLGFLSYNREDHDYISGRVSPHEHSDATTQLIDQEIRLIVDRTYDKARQILTTHDEELHTLAEALLEYETLTGDEIKKLLTEGSIDRPAPTGSEPPSSSTPRRSKMPSTTNGRGKRPKPTEVPT